jgi:hypothetical protein
MPTLNVADRKMLGLMTVGILDEKEKNAEYLAECPTMKRRLLLATLPSPPAALQGPAGPSTINAGSERCAALCLHGRFRSA